jgi:nucleoside-diphosphate-sugar epimerase
LAIERWDHFDGIQWYRQTAAPSSESAPLTATAHAKPALARKELGWEPTVKLEDGLDPTIEYFRKLLAEG